LKVEGLKVEGQVIFDQHTFDLLRFLRGSRAPMSLASAP